jgi:HD-GYP domain-containing protein (c-di-GMP phosphodiesterase class II)
MLYSKDHASVNELTKKALSILSALLKESDAIEIIIVEDDLIINKNPMREMGIHGDNLIKRIKRKGISRIHLLQGVTHSELKQLIADIATTREGIKSYPHIKTGVVDVHIGNVQIDTLDEDFDAEDLSDFTSEQIEKVKEEYNKISPFKKLNVAGFEEMVVKFITMLQKKVNILKLIKPPRSFDEYSYTHATNVAVLTLFQAETLGVREDMLHDIGIAALLHDVGKLLIPKDVTAKEVSSTGEEKIKLHPLYGAQYLANVDGLTRLAPIAAFEHHLRYDGEGYPTRNTGNKKQHICSQIIAISDFFDTLRSTSLYRTSLGVKEMISLMQTKDEGAFNPFLMNNFTRAMYLALS